MGAQSHVASTRLAGLPTLQTRRQSHAFTPWVGSLALTTRRSVQRMKLAVVVPHQQLPSPAHPSSSCLELFSVLSSSICSEAQLQQESMQACCNNSEHGQHFASFCIVRACQMAAHGRNPSI